MISKSGASMYPRPSPALVGRGPDSFGARHCQLSTTSLTPNVTCSPTTTERSEMPRRLRPTNFSKFSSMKSSMAAVGFSIFRRLRLPTPGLPNTERDGTA